METEPLALVIAWGDLGEAVAAYLDGPATVVITSRPAEIDPSVLRRHASGASVVFAVSDRFDSHNFERMSGICTLVGRTFVPLFSQGSRMQFGPAIVPGSSPCWECCVRRMSSHKRGISQHSVIDGFYNTHQELAPSGVLPHIAFTFASFVDDWFRRRAPLQGEVVLMDFLDWRPTTTRLAPVTGCDQCERARLAQAEAPTSLSDVVRAVSIQISH